MKQITTYFAPVQKELVPGGEMRFLATTETPPNTTKASKLTKKMDTIGCGSSNATKKHLVTPVKMGGGRNKPNCKNLGIKNPTPPGEIGPVPAENHGPCWSNNPTNRRLEPETELADFNSQLTGTLELSKKLEREEDWRVGIEEMRGKKGRKRGRSMEKGEVENPAEPKVLKRGKPFENLKCLHVARTGVRIRLESEKTVEPSVASICHKIDLAKIKVRSKDHNDLNGEGINLCLKF